MNLNDLRVFLTVAEASGVNRAAPYLGRVASNVSTRISHLERLFGVPLFIRSNSGMSLTREGEILRTHAYRMLRLFDETRSALDARQQPTLLRIGVVPSLASPQVATLLGTFADKFRRCELSIEQGTSAALQARVCAGELEGAFCQSGEPLAGLESITVDREVLLLVGGKNWNGAPLRRAVGFGPDCEYRKRLQAWYEGRGAAPVSYVEAQGFDYLFHCVASGSALAVVPSSKLCNHPSARLLTTRPLPPPLDSLQIAFVFATDREPRSLLSCMSPPPAGEPPDASRSNEIPSPPLSPQVI
ncbi:MAG: LysR family transcriptional regulator [Pseudomonadota bacterium]